MHLAFCFLPVLLCFTCQVNGRKTKNSNLIKLCGDDFYNMHEYCCKQGCENGKRQIYSSEDYSETGGKAFDLMQKQNALSFLKTRKHPYKRALQRSKRRGDTDNAYEECCIEGCTIEEVREYPCY